MADDNATNLNDSGSFGWAVLGFFIPLAGLILFFVWKNDRPKSAKMALIGFLVSIAASVLWALFTSLS